MYCWQNETILYYGNYGKIQLGSCAAVGQNVIKFCMTVVAYFVIVTKSSRQVWEQMAQLR